MTTTPTASEFRGQVRAFDAGLSERLAEFSQPVERMRAYRRALAEAGLSGISAPIELGGLGLP
ncbi:MAG: acyl-CoA dehydrogenase family protein, partial [Acidimicrobiia bacterium]|nr:acyl-CoA dehydrogenase family protein [Acidimicrobiia bacterium]